MAETERTDAIGGLHTPALLVDLAAFDANSARMRESLVRAGGAVLRPHLKTVKSVPAALRMLGGTDAPITVSTLLEAEQFAGAGFRDILYAVGIAPAKLGRVWELRGRGVDLSVILDNIESARAVARSAQASGDPIPVLIEIDSDGHRAGVRLDDSALLLAIAEALRAGGAELRGVMTHAGGSYAARSGEEIRAAAARERDAVLSAASILRGNGFAAPVVSVGSTPTALYPAGLAGVTEVRAGVYPFMDLVMAGLGVCRLEDIALSVLATVIGHQRDKGWILVDAGWMAMSRDRGTASQVVDQGYGVVCEADGRPYPDLIMASANQEHGILSVRPGSAAGLPDLPVGSLLRILPNHACATAAQFGGYHVLEGGAAVDHWPRFNGW
ncbi:MAG TPA: alanine racemase [Allosphingosinicella sp.]|uniref:alanine racemase n=1 Tax=Allosphingosinicella sp. TaxID=2823234 RepID=UPI002F276453